MIFVTVGTEQYPFDRLLLILENAVRDRELTGEIFAQIGNSKFIPSLYKYERFIDFEIMADVIRKADIVVSHAGEGTTLLCLMLGKTPILFPRMASFREHVDNHQLELARKLSENKKVLAAYTKEDLLGKIKGYRNLSTALESGVSNKSASQLINYLKQICS